LLVAAYNKGCKFDGWSDHFNDDLWQAAIEETGLDPQFFTARPRDPAEPLPWDYIDNRTDKVFLEQEWANAREQKLTQDCRLGACHQCGACDFETVEPKTYRAFEQPALAACEPPEGRQADFQNLCVFYGKQDQAKYFGHLEMVNIFLRAFKRAGIPLKYSQGFHPKPKISFDDPLPIGIESEQERFVLSVPRSINPDTVTRSLNAHLPAGLVVNSSQFIAGKAAPNLSGPSAYRITLRDGAFSAENLAGFKTSPEVTISVSNRKGKLKKINLKDMVVNIELLDSKQLQVSLADETGKTLRPAKILGPVFNLSDNQIKQARIVKLKTREQNG
jgi:radical SAM-linked protein